jgi:hypothetical protein
MGLTWQKHDIDFGVQTASPLRKAGTLLETELFGEHIVMLV